MNGNEKILEKLLEKGGLIDNLPPPYQTAIFLGLLTFLPAMLVCLTGFTRIVVVLSFVRRAVTSQDIPPNVLLIGLGIFLTWFVMEPTLTEIHDQAVSPYVRDEIKKSEAIDRSIASLRKFMLRQTRKNDLALFINLSREAPPADADHLSMRVLVPAFVISELKSAFIMGFCLYLPFLLVDFVVSSVLTSLGMMMMPPVVVSAPLKVLLFVLADGWHLVARALCASFH